MDSALHALRLFNEKAIDAGAAELHAEDLRREEWFLHVLEEGGALKVERYGPDEESIDAFVLSLRFFIQDNEGSSFRRMASLYEAAPVSAQTADEFQEARSPDIHASRWRSNAAGSILADNYWN